MGRRVRTHGHTIWQGRPGLFSGQPYERRRLSQKENSRRAHPSTPLVRSPAADDPSDGCDQTRRRKPRRVSSGPGVAYNGGSKRKIVLTRRHLLRDVKLPLAQHADLLSRGASSSRVRRASGESHIWRGAQSGQGIRARNQAYACARVVADLPLHSAKRDPYDDQDGAPILYPLEFSTTQLTLKHTTCATDQGGDGPATALRPH